MFIKACQLHATQFTAVGLTLPEIYLVHPFQPQPIWVDKVDVSQWNTTAGNRNYLNFFQPFQPGLRLVEKVDQPNHLKFLFSKRSQKRNQPEKVYPKRTLLFHCDLCNLKLEIIVGY